MDNPLHLFDQWFADARACVTIPDATAMTLATVAANGAPSLRVVLLKAHGPEGFVFYTNLHSRKSRELEANAQAALCFHWAAIELQVRIEGSVSLVTDAEADRYFATRPRISQIGAWASLQSEPMAKRELLETRAAQYEKEFAGRDVPRPPHWSGWRLPPEAFEFWHQQNGRLHEREVYRRTIDGGWQHGLLYP